MGNHHYRCFAAGRPVPSADSAKQVANPEASINCRQAVAFDGVRWLALQFFARRLQHTPVNNPLCENAWFAPI